MFQLFITQRLAFMYQNNNVQAIMQKNIYENFFEWKVKPNSLILDQLCVNDNLQSWEPDILKIQLFYF